MLMILITIAVAGRVKSLLTALIVAFVLPFLVLLMDASPANLGVTLPINLAAAFLAFQYYERRRERQKEGVAVKAAPIVRNIKMVLIAFILILLGYLAHLLVSTGTLV